VTTGRIDRELLGARNMLTQRTFGPECGAETRIDVSGMKEGDCAGICVLQKHYGFVGVRSGPDGKSVVMVGAESGTPGELASVPLGDAIVHLKVDCDFRKRTDKAYFYCSTDGKEWTRIGAPLRMTYTLPHFMGYRFGLFHFATKSPGGSVDFDYFRLSDRIAPVP
jgi:beta-xylosidase